ncbi:protein of unknown function [Cupriavidus taiwanensis]|nr:protein of unknown function [Cupriavidus taiwanensis]
MTRFRSILCVPYPFPDESASSWIARVCQFHDISYKALTTSLGMNPVRDPDITSDRDHICRIGSGTCVSPKRLRELSDAFHAVQLQPSLKKLLTFDNAKAPSYRYCPECLASDPIPYLRNGWRLRDWMVCPAHLTPLLHGCPHCGAPLRCATSSRGRAGKRLPAIGQCPECKSSMVAESRQVNSTIGINKNQISLQYAILSAVRSGSLTLSGLHVQVPLEFLIWLRENNSSINEYKTHWLAMWTSQKRSYTAAELEKRVTEAYDLERKNRFNGNYTVESYITFYKSYLADSAATVDACSEYVEQNRFSYFMSRLVSAYHFLGNKKVTFSSLCRVGRKGRKRSSSQFREACWNASSLRQESPARKFKDRL